MSYIPVGELVRIQDLTSAVEIPHPGRYFDALIVSVEHHSVRYTATLTGQTPTADAIGILLPIGVHTLYYAHPTIFKFIRTSDSPHIVYQFVVLRQEPVHQV